MNSQESMQPIGQQVNTTNSVTIAPFNPFSLLDDDEVEKKVTRSVLLMSGPASAGARVSNAVSALGAEPTAVTSGFTVLGGRNRSTKNGDKPVPVPEQEYKYQYGDAKFLIDLAALLMGMDPRTSDPSAGHHSVAKQSLDAILGRVFRARPEVRGLMETLKSDKKKEKMRYRLAGCAQLLIAVTSPPRDGAAPSVLVVVYKTICRGLFEILAVVFGVDTGGILGVLRSRVGKSEKVQALTKYFHVENGHGAREILLLFRRLVECDKGRMEDIVNWVITVMYVDQMAPMFDSKYPGIIHADKYYKMRTEGRPRMSNRDAHLVEILLQHTNVHFRNTPSGNFDPAWILYKLKVPPAVAIAVTTIVLECVCENDAKMDFQGDLSRKDKWEYGLQKFKEVFKDPGFLMSLLHEEEAAEIESKKQKDNQPTAKPLTIAISKPSLPPMRNEERKSNPFGPEALVGALDGGSIDPETVVTTTNSEVEVRMHMMHLAQKSPVQMELKAPELIPQQHAIEHSLFLGHVFPAPGFLLTNGPDFIIREMSDFKVPGIKMLLLLVTGKPIKTGGIRIDWAGPNIQIDTTGSGMATYQIAGHAVRGFAAIHYPDLAAVCEYDSQSWCYMKNGGNLCTRTHKHQDGGDLSF